MLRAAYDLHQGLNRVQCASVPHDPHDKATPGENLQHRLVSIHESPTERVVLTGSTEVASGTHDDGFDIADIDVRIGRTHQSNDSCHMGACH